ncbi:hypothetical protein [Nitrosospira briensis]|uniref:hypothetical protein n=1 Tax=Nitrosospira briensis TaxID=35799 RepID=UPI00046AF1D2|nr:hypothetical protein [Nitrosospira briensis]
MDESAHRIRAYQSQQPQDNQNNCDCIEHDDFFLFNEFINGSGYADVISLISHKPGDAYSLFLASALQWLERLWFSLIWSTLNADNDAGCLVVM